MRAACPHCGSAYATWTPEAILEAARAWQRTHGHAPRVNEWHKASPANPSKRTVYRHFTSWPDFLEQAGLQPHPWSKEWNRADILHAILQWKYDHDGELPRYHDWDTAGENHPHRATVTKRFGSWNAAIVAFGDKPRKMMRTVDGYRRQAGYAKRAANGTAPDRWAA